MVLGFGMFLLLGAGYGLGTMIAEMESALSNPTITVSLEHILVYSFGSVFVLVLSVTFTVFLLRTFLTTALEALMSSEPFQPSEFAADALDMEPEIRKKVTVRASNPTVAAAEFGWLIAGGIWVIFFLLVSRLLHSPTIPVAVLTAAVGSAGAFMSWWMIRTGWKYAALAKVRVTFAKLPLRLPGGFSGRVVLPEGMDVENVSLSLCCEEIGDLVPEDQFLDDDPLVALPIRSVRVKPSRFRFARRLSPEECHQFGPRPDEDKWWLELRPVGVTYRGEPFGPSEIALSYPLDVYNTQTRDTVGDPDEGENQAPPKLMGVGEDVSPFKWLLKEFKASTLLGLIPGTIMGGLSAIRWLMHDDAFLASIPESFLRGFLFLFAPRFLVGILARTRRSIRHHLLVSFACTYGMALTYALIKYLVLAPLGTTEVSPLPSKSLVILATISGFILGVYADELPDIYRNFGKEFREARKLEEDV